ncbi:response regulator transcription factor [Aestuariimicrobium ganziense]|uniref:response regulator transcription factor n=1 Tax=Aestuariimicrobium ganziense TaxID=2773677 RepID=UPI001945AA24|nr:response regulator transcription factor [Aestuariimicrobium ganziense]
MNGPTPLRVALVNDYEVVVKGLRQMLLPYAERVNVVELDVAHKDINTPVDIALYDSFAHEGLSLNGVRELIRDQQVRHVVLYTWTMDSHYVDAALGAGASGVLSKAMGGAALVSALERISAGQRLVSASHPRNRDQESAEPRRNGDWPGREAGLTQREAEMVALITRGLTNADIAERTYLSPNSVKSYIRSAYKKIGVVRRSQAVAWGIGHGMGREPRTTQSPITPATPPSPPR